MRFYPLTVLSRACLPFHHIDVCPIGTVGLPVDFSTPTVNQQTS